MTTIADGGRSWPCADCGKLRTKDEGGTLFTICDACWEKRYARPDVADDLTATMRAVADVIDVIAPEPTPPAPPVGLRPARAVSHAFLRWSANILSCSEALEGDDHNEACDRLTGLIEADRRTRTP